MPLAQREKFLVVEIDVVRRFLELKADINAPMSKANSSPTSGKSLMYFPQAASTGAHSMQRRTRIR